MINREFFTTGTSISLTRRQQPYLRHNMSQNAYLCSKKPCLIKGSTDNQVEAPFSFARSMDRFIALGLHVLLVLQSLS